MLSNIGFGELVIIIVLGLILFGPQKLPGLGRAAGQTFREFKQAFSGLIDPEPDRKEAGKEGKADQRTKAPRGGVSRQGDKGV